MSKQTPEIDALAQAIRVADGNHDLGAGALAEALMPTVRALMAEAWQEGAFYYGGDNAEQWYFNDDGANCNPYRVIPPEKSER